MRVTSGAAPSPTGRGCLTEQQVELVRGAVAGDVPDGLARHLAVCQRCQERALFGALRPRRRRREELGMPTTTRALILLGAMVAAMVAFFFTLHQLIGGG